MISDELKRDTIEYAKAEQGSLTSDAAASENRLKESFELRATKAAYKGIITRQKNIIKRTPHTRKNQKAIESRQADIARYNRIVDNLGVISVLPQIYLGNMGNVMDDLQTIYDYDVQLRGKRDVGAQPLILATIERLDVVADGLLLLKDILDNVDSDCDRETDFLRAFKVYLRKQGYPTSQAARLIRRWKKECHQKVENVLIWALVYDTLAGFKKGVSERSSYPAGTYALFNTDMDATDPKTLFGLNLNPGREDSKENIFYWFKRRFGYEAGSGRGGIFDVANQHEWQEKKNSLEIYGFGYVDFQQQEKVMKWLKKEGRQVEIAYPARIYDPEEFKRRYLAWKAKWMRKLRLTEEGWQNYIDNLAPDLREFLNEGA